MLETSKYKYNTNSSKEKCRHCFKDIENTGKALCKECVEKFTNNVIEAKNREGKTNE